MINTILQTNLPTVTETANGITNFGLLAMTAAFFLVLSAALMISCFRWFRNIISNIVSSQNESMKELLTETREQNAKLGDIIESLRPTTLQQVKALSALYFDLSVEKVCRIIKKIRTENHVADKEATEKKIRNLLTTVFNNQNMELDNWTFRNRKLSEYVKPEWLDWVCEIVENEIYHVDGQNNGRAYTNINAVYDKIKFDYYHQLIK